MSAIQLEVDEAEFARVKRCADLEHVSVQEFVRRVVLSAAGQLEYLQERAKGADWEDFQRIMAKVPDVPPMPGDELPEGWNSEPNKH